MKLMAAENETLYEHIDEALRKYYEIFLSNGYDKFIANKFKNLSINGDYGALAGLAILLHDAGKAHFRYQLNLKRPGISHEAYSAALAWNVLLLNENEKGVVAATILLHHEYIRLPDPNSITEEFKGHFEELKNILDKLSLNYGLRNYLDISKITALPREDVRAIIKYLGRKLRDKKFYFHTILNLHPLVICDNFSASLHRGGASPKLLEDFECSNVTSRIQDHLKKVLRIT
ncbi:MAG: CRISPR-associated endonuclease Cas3'' [Candidatus Bathyarchaeia archaeon]